MKAAGVITSYSIHYTKLYDAGSASREAEVAAAKLAALGYTDVRILDGGITAWAGAGLPLAGPAPSAPLPDPAVLPPSPGRYGLVPGECSLEWVGRNKNGRHVGTVPVRSGGLDFTGGTLRVITSYSIHYTKLYDPCRVRDA